MNELYVACGVVLLVPSLILNFSKFSFLVPGGGGGLCFFLRMTGKDSEIFFVKFFLVRCSFQVWRTWLESYRMAHAAPVKTIF